MNHVLSFVIGVCLDGAFLLLGWQTMVWMKAGRHSLEPGKIVLLVAVWVVVGCGINVTVHNPLRALLLSFFGCDNAMGFGQLLACFIYFYCCAKLFRDDDDDTEKRDGKRIKFPRFETLFQRTTTNALDAQNL